MLFRMRKELKGHKQRELEKNRLKINKKLNELKSGMAENLELTDDFQEKFLKKYFKQMNEKALHQPEKPLKYDVHISVQKSRKFIQE